MLTSLELIDASDCLSVGLEKVWPPKLSGQQNANKDFPSLFSTWVQSMKVGRKKGCAFPVFFFFLFNDGSWFLRCRHLEDGLVSADRRDEGRHKCIASHMLCVLCQFLKSSWVQQKEKKILMGPLFFISSFFPISVAFPSDWWCALTDALHTLFTLSCFCFSPSTLRGFRAGPNVQRLVSSIFHHRWDDVLFTAPWTPVVSYLQWWQR